MTKIFNLLVLLAAAGAGYSQIQDSSDLIFNDAVVNRYRIDFYVPDWHDSLVYNKTNGETYIPARMTWYNPSGDSMVLDSVGVRYKGNSSYNIASEKKPFKLAFDKYRKNQRFFSLKTLNFSNCVLDPTMMREKIAYDVLKKYMPSPRAAFATLTVEDSLTNCFFTQVEQVDEQFLIRHFKNDKDNLYKVGDQGASLDYISADKVDYKPLYELKTNEKKDDWTGFINLLEKLKNTSDADFLSVVGKYLDIDNCIRYLAFNMVNGNFDSYTGSGRNFYLYDDLSYGKFRWIPWDVNLSFGAYAYSWLNEITTVNVFNPSNLDQRPLENKILANDSLKRVYANYMKSMIEGPLSVDSVSALAHKYALVIDPFVKADPKKFFTYEQFLRNVDSNVIIQAGPQKTYYFGLKWYTDQRNASVLSQIDNALPVIDHEYRNLNAAVPSLYCLNEVSGKNVNIHYTLKSPVYSDVIINIFNVKGERVYSQNDGCKVKGSYAVNFKMQSAATGCYIVVLNAGKFTVSRSLLLVH